MANLKKFTTYDGRAAWINTDHISLAEPFNEDKEEGYVRITFNNGTQISLTDAIRFIEGENEETKPVDGFSRKLDYTPEGRPDERSPNFDQFLADRLRAVFLVGASSAPSARGACRT